MALKVIRAEFAEDPEFRRRFRREVATARAVGGDRTAPVADADAAMPWPATSYVSGPSLATVVGRFGPLPEHTVRAIGVGLAEALTAIHAGGLIHRDLKPSNVLLAAAGPRVIDFGIARAVEDSDLTTSGIVIGTPAFMSPKQASARPLGPASQERVAAFSAKDGSLRWIHSSPRSPADRPPVVVRGTLALWPTGVAGSITHCDGYTACAVAPTDRVASLGIDAEPARPLPPGILGLTATAAEQDGLTRLPPGPTPWDRLLFSAKEAVYKAWYPLTHQWAPLAGTPVTLHPDGTFTTERGGRAFTGHWHRAGGILITTIVIP